MVRTIAKLIDLTIGKYIIRHADHVVCVSEAGKKWVMETFGRKINISVIYRGFEFPRVERRKNTVPKIGFVGRLVSLKNVSGLLEALADMKEQSWTLEIIGDGEERTRLEHLTETL
jgi:glycosyltransferase involved in cell wall biosynthesis